MNIEQIREMLALLRSIEEHLGRIEAMMIMAAPSPKEREFAATGVLTKEELLDLSRLGNMVRGHDR